MEKRPNAVEDRSASGPNAGADDGWVEQLLLEDARADRDAHIDDAGFTARIMDALPEPARELAIPRWRKPALTAIWATAGISLAFALPGTVQDIAREAFRLFAAKPFSLSELAALVAAVGIATYASAAVTLRRD